MIQDVLDASRVKAGEGIPVTIRESNLDEIVASTAAALSIVFGPRFKFGNDDGAIVGHGDPTGVQRIVENLAGNAAGHSAARRRIDRVG